MATEIKKGINSVSVTGLSDKAWGKINDKKTELLKTQRSVSHGEAIEALINPSDTNTISDGYHTFGELYEHRIVLYIALCERLVAAEENEGQGKEVWKSRKHSDGSVWDGWFLLGINKKAGEQITYHLPEKYWMKCNFDELQKAPDFDGHTSADVLERISKL